MRFCKYCGQTTVKTDTVNKPKLARTETNPNLDSSLIGQFKKYKIHTLTDTIKADLNGDKVFEISYFADNDTKKGIIIVDGQTKKQTNVGLDKSFGDMGIDFSWVDFWGTTGDTETYEVTIKDSEVVGDRKIKLDNTSLFLRKDEVGGGVITFKNGKYIWIHQSD